MTPFVTAVIRGKMKMHIWAVVRIQVGIKAHTGFDSLLSCPQIAIFSAHGAEILKQKKIEGRKQAAGRGVQYKM